MGQPSPIIILVGVTDQGLTSETENLLSPYSVTKYLLKIFILAF
jgi:hypothetical protein